MPYAVIREYTDAPGLADALHERIEDVTEVLRSIPSFRSWNLLRVGNGVMTMTVCDTQAGVDESVTRAAAYMQENLADMKLQPPKVTQAEAVHRVTQTEVLP